jgi:hypothetical protein
MGARVSRTGQSSTRPLSTTDNSRPESKGIALNQRVMSNPAPPPPPESEHESPAPVQVTDHHHHKSASRRNEKNDSKMSASNGAVHSKRRSRKKQLPTEDTNFENGTIEPEHLDHDYAASVQTSDTSHAWLSEALTEDRENTEEIIRSLRNQLLGAQQDRDNLQLELDKAILRSSNEKARLDRLLLVAAKETARVEEEKLKVLMELATFKDKAIQDKAASEAEMRRLRAELAMSNRHEGEDAPATSNAQRVQSRADGPGHFKRRQLLLSPHAAMHTAIPR